MAIDQESFNKRLYDIFKTRGYKPSPKDSKNERTNPETADVFEFQFVKDGKNYGKAWATIDKTSSLNLYYDDTQSGSPAGQTKGVDYDDSWTGLLKHLKQWALSKQLNFGLHDSDRLGDDMRQRDYYKMKEKMNEGYHAVNQKTSYNDNIPNVKVVIQHDRAVREGEQRWRNVHKIFVENTEGERFAVPTRMPGIARVYGRHVAEGGTPYDERGKHITTLVEEYTKMAGFVRATRRGEFNESVAKLIAEGVNHHKSLKESLQKMQSHRGYNHYFESWTPPLMEDDSDSSSIAEMFAQGTIDPRIESVLPILNRLNSGIINEIEEVNELDQWAKELTEMDQVEEAIKLPEITPQMGDNGSNSQSVISGKSITEEEKKDTHCSAKCCGADVKAEDCGCSPDCPHCNCNKDLTEDSGCACGCGPKDKCTCDASCSKCDCGKEKIDEGRVKDIIHDAMDMSREEFDAKYKGEWSYDEAIADYKDNDNDPINEGKFNQMVVDALEMNEKDFAEAYPLMAHRYNDILDAFDEKDLQNKLDKPEQGELFSTQGELDITEDSLNNDEIAKNVRRQIKIFKQDADGDQDEIDTLIKNRIRTLKNQGGPNEPNRARRRDIGYEARLLLTYMKKHGGIHSARNARDGARKEADRLANQDDSDTLSMQDKVTVGRAGVGIAGALAGMFAENQKVNEFMRDEYDDDKPSRPKKGKLVTKDGQEVVLPLITQDFRGDEMIVTGYKAPEHSSSTGRIYTDDGMSYFPGVASLKIIDHDYSNDIDEAVIDDTDFSAKGIDKEIKMAYGILNDPRFKGGNLAGAIKAIEGIMPGLSEHPGVKKAIYKTQNEPDNLEEAIKIGKKGFYVNVHPLSGEESPMSFSQFQSTWYDEFKDDPEARNITSNQLSLKFDTYMDELNEKIGETKSGGMTFAGNYKTGKAGQWRNTGPTKGKPAKVGDLVGAESKNADDEMSVHQKHEPDNMLEDILRLSGRSEYKGKSTGKGAGTEYKGYGR